MKMHHHTKGRTWKGTPPMPESSLERRRTRRKLTAGALVEIGESLAEIDWRLLHWLLRYPLQRADDMVVGVARWASRATVYRHVQALETRGLVESVLPKTPGTGKRLYHLSNLGLHLLARYLDRPARTLAQSGKQMKPDSSVCCHDCLRCLCSKMWSMVSLTLQQMP
jgi:predicted transcriptional regulator